MDLPVKFEVPRLTHADLLSVLLPVVPGAIIALDVFWVGFRPLRFLAENGVG